MAPDHTDKRAHKRIETGYLIEHMFVVMPGHAPARVQNISYGGVAFAATMPADAAKAGDTPSFHLAFASLAFPFKAKILRRIGGACGCQFVDLNLAGIKNLRLMIEGHAMGASAQPMDPKHFNDFSSFKFEHHLRGAGPVDICIGAPRAAAGQGQVMFVSMGKDSVEIHGDRIQTIETTTGRYVGGDIQLHAQVATTVVHRALFVLAGAMDTPSRPLVEPILARLLKHVAGPETRG